MHFDEDLDVELPEHILKQAKTEELDYEDLSYKNTLLLDKRSIFTLFFTFFFRKIEIIAIFCFRNDYSIVSLLLSVYLTKTFLDFTLNALLYTDDMISKKYENNGSLDTSYTLILSFSSSVICSFIGVLIDILTQYESQLELVEQEAQNDAEYNYFMCCFMKKIKRRVKIYLLFQFILILVCSYYVIIFCSVYSKSQVSLVTNYFTRFFTSFIVTVSAAFIATFLRKLAIL